MTEEHYKRLTKYFHIWAKYKKDSTIVNIDFATLKDLESIYMEVFNSRGVNLTCKDCIADMFKQLFNQYDNYVIIPKRS